MAHDGSTGQGSESYTTVGSEPGIEQIPVNIVMPYLYDSVIDVKHMLVPADKDR